MFRLFLGFLVLVLCYSIIIVPVETASNQRNQTKGCNDEYNPPGTVKFPLGDEELNTDILEKPGINEAYESKSNPAEICPLKSFGGAIESTHIPCGGIGEENITKEVLYSSDSDANPVVQCKKCDLKVIPEGTAVIVRCFECYDIPPPLHKKMWTCRIAKYKPRIAQGFVRNRSQAVITKALIEDTQSDINSLKVAEKLHGFQVLGIQDIPVFNIRAVQLQHERTKTYYVHLYRNDNNNVFSINFRTTPKNSTGLPHILEHIVLCGSKLYPVRDPFFKMLNRSLATFMNAMTGSDYTLYPFSTQNIADYRNLQKIYLDAVFRPNLNILDFMQEGWRLENENPQDINSKIMIKGVVFNEMKGAFSENESLLMQKLQNLILPDNTYGVVSGGDPLKIPNLTWEDLKNFHRQCYHPSNARFYSYGNFPIIPTLEYLNLEYLSHYDYRPPDHTIVPQQTRWKQAKKEHITGRFENMRETFEKQNTITVSLVMSDITNIYETFLIGFLTQLLVKGPNAPFYKSMIEPNFSGGFTPCTGFDTQPRDSVFTIGLQGLKKADFDKVTTIFEKTIAEVINNGFDQKHVESVLHTYELSTKHETSNFGLALLLGLTPVLNHNGNIVESLEVDKLIGRLRKELTTDNKYLQKAVEKYFKNNQHRLVLTMSPDKEYEQQQVKLEKNLISEKTNKLTDSDKKAIYEKAQELLTEQAKKQNIDLLPTLQIEDISSDIERNPCEKIKVGPVATQVNTVNTNGITYFKGILNTSELSAEQQMLLPLLCYIISKMGTKNLDYREFDSLVKSKTAGLSLDLHLAESLYQLHSYEPGILISSYCLDENIESMWNIWQQIFNIPQFKNIQRFQMLVQLYMANLTHGLVDSGHLYAMQAASGLVSGAGYQKELLTGLQHIAYMKRLVQTSSYDAMLNELTNIARILFDKNKLRCSLNVSQSSKSHIFKAYEKFINDLPGNTFGKPNENAFSITKVWTPADSANCQHHVLNVPVYYCSKAVLTVPYTDPDYARLRVLAKVLCSKYLHPELREKQGAYGGGVRIAPDGVLAFFSYRDPNSFKTLDVFDYTHKWLQKELSSVTSQDILEAKLGVFQAVDAPIPPSAKGNNEFIRGITPDVLQRHRAEIMVVDNKGLQSVSERFLGNSKDPVVTGKVILGPKNTQSNPTKRSGELWTVLDNEYVFYQM